MPSYGCLQVKAQMSLATRQMQRKCLHLGGLSPLGWANQVDRQRGCRPVGQQHLQLAVGQLFFKQPGGRVANAHARQHRAANHFAAVGLQVPLRTDGDLCALGLMRSRACRECPGVLCGQFRIDDAVVLLQVLRHAGRFQALGQCVQVVVAGHQHALGGADAFGHHRAVGQFADAQGVIAGAGTLYTYSKMVSLLGPSRAAVFPALAPGLAALMAWPVLGHVPALAEAIGLLLVMTGLLVAVTSARVAAQKA